ncbi:TPA: hypothetical protein N0F65_012641 [Lagenidium giganteum]|uniref:Retrovirus-related Pol polyprotein from transposon TNT 1-94 n=1 Tax=Lagenidium giganteum TaxID=4803 RepID=A0AAV2YPA3_9STRA|nr:TPA: hypothetical protein N0F65_012641 [Lagenidium giganteum]
MQEGTRMSSHLDKFNELVLILEAVGDVMDQVRQVTILMSSLPAEYDTIVTIIENASCFQRNLDVKRQLWEVAEQ